MVSAPPGPARAAQFGLADQPDRPRSASGRSESVLPEFTNEGVAGSSRV